MTATLPEASNVPPLTPQSVGFGRCACLHPDPYECAVLRYAADGVMSREKAQEDVQLFGGCSCDCHEDEDEDEDDPREW